MTLKTFNIVYLFFTVVLTISMCLVKASGMHPNFLAFSIIMIVMYIYGRLMLVRSKSINKF